MSPARWLLLAAASFLVTCLASVVLFVSQQGKRKALAPLGGPFWKNWLAYLMLRMQGAHKPKEYPIEMTERRNFNEKEKHFSDSFYFLAVGKPEDEFLWMTARLGFRNTHSEVWLLVQTKTHGRIKVREEIVKGRKEDPNVVEAGGLTFTCLTPAKEWRLTYKGEMFCLDKGNVKVDAELNVTFTALTERFPYNMDVWALAKSMAEKPWTKEFFAGLKSEKASRIEQGGVFNGVFSIDGEAPVVLKDVSAIRDHAWGKRNWTNVTKYFWNPIAFETPLIVDGFEVTHMVYSTVDYGTSFSNLVCGWALGSKKGDHRALTHATLMKETGIVAGVPFPNEHTLRFMIQGSNKLFELTIKRDNSHLYCWNLNGESTTQYFECNEARCDAVVKCNDKKVASGVGMCEIGHTRDNPMPIQA